MEDQVIFKGIGFYLLTVVSAIVVFIAFMLGKVSNGFPAEISVLLGAILTATEILIILIIKRKFKIEDS